MSDVMREICTDTQKVDGQMKVGANTGSWTKDFQEPSAAGVRKEGPLPTALGGTSPLLTPPFQVSGLQDWTRYLGVFIVHPECSNTSPRK